MKSLLLFFTRAFILAALALYPGLSFAQCLQDKSTTAQDFVSRFYDWYLKKDANIDTVLAQKSECLDPKLVQLMKEERKRWGCEEPPYLDFDPFIHSQDMDNGASIKVRKVSQKEGQTLVDITLKLFKGHDSGPDIQVVLNRNSGWRIANLIYQNTMKDEKKDLLGILRYLEKEKSPCPASSTKKAK